MESVIAPTAQEGELHPVDQARRFLSVLMHDDHDAWYGLHISYTTCGNHVWEPNVTRLCPSEVPSFDVTAFDGFDSYVNVNGFCGRLRTESNLRHVNALMFDLDHEAAHRGDVSGGDLERDKAAAVSLLRRHVVGGGLPMPTMVVDTGRGLQLHYVLERTASYRNSKGDVNGPLLAVVRKARKSLAVLLGDLCSDPSCRLSLDERAKDLSRVCRVPGSTNTSSGTRARLLSCDGPLWSLEGLLASVPNQPCRCRPSKRTVRSPRVRSGEAKADSDASELLCRLRMSKLSELRDLREAGGGCTGSRNELMFCYVNSAMPVYGPARTLELGRRFNDGFSEPLPDAEVRASVSGIERNGAYRFSRRRLAEHVMLTAIEEGQVGFFDLPLAKEARRRAEEDGRADARARRDAEVISLARSGLSYASIAKRVGISRRTVCSVLRRAGYSRRRRSCPESVSANVPVLVPRRGPSKASIVRLGLTARVSSDSAIFCPHTYCEGRVPVSETSSEGSPRSFVRGLAVPVWPTGQTDGHEGVSPPS